MEPPPELSRDVYTVGWVCVTESELLAARVLLDKKHTRPSVSTDDIYHVGQMGLHNVVIAQPVSVGKASAAVTAVNMIRSFQNIRFVLMVGTGGGATHAPPRPGELHPLDIFLGDVVVSTSGHGHGEWV
ncbi:hypothetical protein N7509_012817 [Penicillium cosmopolitanum]|uniref:Nucleoside phosphorylase domain-containing protein n=1 Tax=Penicillium cosmopolitanum TaxID=1131564 RepID=A0A9W9SC40_9EURO|nr:uncharacterized protein N7509_012817 [Penicillium cosmopolitanum]KAJ5375931.1 hypothetical protein N7509_012817 [Penicillium cosmopolitanum]